MLLLATLAAPPADAAPLFGFTTSATRQQFNDAPSPQSVAQFSDWGGADIARIGISWEAVQPKGDGSGNAAYSNWTKFDVAIQELRQVGVRPLIMIADAPRWAHEDRPCNWDHCPPDAAHMSDWASFAADVTRRYPDAVGIEIWNSPNTWAWWPVDGGPNPRQYAVVVNWAMNAIHKASTSATDTVPVPVIWGAVGYTKGGSGGSRGTTPIPQFMNGVYDNLNRRLFHRVDGLSVHAYPATSEITTLNGRFARTMEQIRAVRDARDAARKIWVSEAGISTTGDEAVSDYDQMRTLWKVAVYYTQQTDIAGWLIYTLVEGKWSPNAPQEMGYGIIRRGEGEDLIPKMAYCIFSGWAGTPDSVTGCNW